jgi:hypothetical protein
MNVPESIPASQNTQEKGITRRKYGIDLDEYDDEAYNAARELFEQEEFIDLANLVNNDPVEYITKIIKRTVKGEETAFLFVIY